MKQGFFAKLFADKNNLKLFLIAFFAFIFVFGGIASGVILVSNATKNNTSSAVSQINSTASYTPGQDDGFNVMILGFNDNSGPVKSIQLMRVDPAKGQLPIISFPTFTLSQTGGKFRSLSECYSEGGRSLLQTALHELTNANIDYYVSINLSGFKSVLNKLGKITFTLKRDVEFTDNTDPEHPIQYSLKAGKNILDAEKAVVVMRYPHYTGGDVERGNIHAQFIKAIITQKLNNDLFKNPEGLYSKYAGFVQTDFSIPNFLTHLNAIKYVINLGGEQIQYLDLPGGTKILNSKSYFQIDNSQATDLFTAYFSGQ